MKLSDPLRGIIIGVGTFILVACASLSIMLCTEICTPIWIPLVICLVIALSTGTVACRYLIPVTRMRQFWPNYILYTVALTLILFFAVLLINRLAVRDDGSGWRNALVEKVYRKKQHQTKRVSRKVYINTGHVYYTYGAKVRTEDDLTPDIRLTYRQYQRVNKGDTVRLYLRQGFFGMPILVRDSINVFPKETACAGRRVKTPFGVRAR